MTFFFFSCFGLGAMEVYQNQCEHVVNNSLIDLSSNNKTLATPLELVLFIAQYLSLRCTGLLSRTISLSLQNNLVRLG